jgi:AcrR family transcriptional regulator
MATPLPSADDHTAHADPSSRDRLMQAAVEIFGRKGYAAASVREIVARAGVTKPVLYYHFKSKEGLMTAIIDEAFREVSAVVDKAARQGGTVREQVIGLCESLREMVRGHTSELRVVHAVYYFAPELLPSFDFRVFERLIIGEFQRLIKAGIAAGELRPVSPMHAAVALGSVLSSFLDQELLPQDVALDDVDLSQVLNLVFDGLCPTA